MSISITDRKKQYDGNGVTTAFSTTFPFLENSHIVVTSTVVSTGVSTTKALTVDYTLSGAGTGSPGTVTMLVAPPSGTRLTIERTVPLTQGSQYPQSDPFPSATTEDAFDKLTMISQQLAEAISRCLQFPSTDPVLTAILANSVDRANGILGFDANGNVTLVSNVTSSTAAAASYAAQALAYRDAAAASAAAAAASAASVSLPATPVAGDMLTHNGSAFIRLAKGTGLQLLRMNSGATTQEYFTAKLPPQTPTSGDIQYYDGSNWVSLAKGTASQQLRMNAGATAPEWFTPSSTTEFTTGDFKLTLKTSPDSGWVMCDDGTIGDATSGASNRANADTSALFTLLWNNISDTYAPVVTGRGANAAADFAAHKKITLTKMLGRALAIAGAGSGLTSRALGLNLGEEDHTLVTAEIESHVHNELFSDGSTIKSSGGAGANPYLPNSLANSNNATVTTTGAAGGGSPHNNMQPSSFVNIMLKL